MKTCTFGTKRTAIAGTRPGCTIYELGGDLRLIVRKPEGKFQASVHRKEGWFVVATSSISEKAAIAACYKKFVALATQMNKVSENPLPKKVDKT